MPATNLPITHEERLESKMLGHNRKMSGAECLADMLKGYLLANITDAENRTRASRITPNPAR